MQQLSDLDYDAIENAVMETARGRWFLSEYKKRNSGASTSTLLDAISRLEIVVTNLNDGSYAAKAPNASSDAPKLVEVKSTPTKELKQAKTLIAPTPFFSGGKKQQPVESKKVEAVSVPEPAALNDENLKFFSHDEDLFSDDANDLLPDAAKTEAAPAVSPVKEVKIEKAPEVKAETSDNVETKLDDETVNLSNRFKVFRTEPKDLSIDTETVSAEPQVAEIAAADTVEAAPEPQLDELFGQLPADDQAKLEVADTAVEAAPIEATPFEAAPVQAPSVETLSVEVPAVPEIEMHATDDEKDRIVIIRGNADTGLDIPFGDDIFGDKQDKPTLS